MFRWSSGVPQDHPLRAVRKLTDSVLHTLSPEFDALYADSGRPSIAPEYILRALLLQVFYLRAFGAVAGRADRLQPAVPLVCGPWHGRHRMEPHAVFSKNRDRLLTSDVAQRFFRRGEQACQAIYER